MATAPSRAIAEQGKKSVGSRTCLTKRKTIALAGEDVGHLQAEIPSLSEYLRSTHFSWQ
jgi:hypothetical protein